MKLKIVEVSKSQIPPFGMDLNNLDDILTREPFSIFPLMIDK